MMKQEENNQKGIKKLNPESREYFRYSLAALVVGGVCAIGAGISYCTDRTDPELQNQYKNCQYLLDNAKSDESKKFVYDDLFLMQGKYKGKTCREIIDLYKQR